MMKNNTIMTLAAALVSMALAPMFSACDGFGLNTGSTTVLCYLDSANESRGYITGNGVYNVGDTVRMEAVANDGYLFTNWYITNSKGAMDLLTNGTDLSHLDENSLDSIYGLYNEDETDNPYVFVAKDDFYYFMANFIDTADRHNIKIKVRPQQTTSGSGEYELFSMQKISARNTTTVIGGDTVEATFRKWHDGNTDNPRSIKVTHQRTYLALYDTARRSAR